MNDLKLKDLLNLGMKAEVWKSAGLLDEKLLDEKITVLSLKELFDVIETLENGVLKEPTKY